VIFRILLEAGAELEAVLKKSTHLDTSSRQALRLYVIVLSIVLS
jgi:hypothetical protein